MNILGISAFYHDAAAALIQDGRIIAAAEEERFSRKKHDASFPSLAIRACMEEAGIGLDKIDAVVFYEKPLLKFERLLETYYSVAPKGIISFLTSMPVWMKEKLFLRKLITKNLAEFGDAKKVNLLFSEHHLSHAASAFYPSPFEEAAILTIDGVGEWATTSISHGKGKDITALKEMRFPHSLGLLYSAFTYYLGFTVNSGEYKLMGLAPYGDAASPEFKEYYHTIKNHLIKIFEDGSFHMDQQYFAYTYGLRMVVESKWEKLFGFPRRKPEDIITPQHCHLALAIQKITGEIVTALAKEAKRITGSDNLCLAGGVALNCVANGRLLNENIFGHIYIQPAAGDAGAACGAALAAWHIHYGKERNTAASSEDPMQGAFLGPDLSDEDIKKVTVEYQAPFGYFDSQEELCSYVAGLIGKGSIIGWVQGRMEFGPRALGHRSILADARDPEMQKRLNLNIKFRESFRPFAPAILAEDYGLYFDKGAPSPYMMYVQEISEKIRSPLPANYASLPMHEKLNYPRSALPAITHIDYTARIQTVEKEANPLFHMLLSTFKELAGVGVLINTSFNLRGEPIVNTPEEAYKCFMRCQMDFLVLGHYVFDKKAQGAMQGDDGWNEVKD